MWKLIEGHIDDLYSEMVDIRRYLHQNPELSFKEEKTAAFIADYYNNLGIEPRTNVGGNGVVAKIKGGKPGKTIALRADFDALPIQDQKDVPYKSKVPGVMHACGHDGHTATLLCLAKAIQKEKENFPGTVVFLHQHAEEYAPGGAKPMIDDHCLDGVDYVFGVHLWSNTPVGVIQTSPEAFMAGADRFEIVIKGKGGHGAQPHQTKDSIVIASEVVTQLQQVVSRRINPLDSAVLSIGKFEAGDAFNIIADQAKLIGTVRTFDDIVQDRIIEEMERIIKGVCMSYGASYTMDYLKGYPPVINHPTFAKGVMEKVTDIAGIQKAEWVDPYMTGEDFSYYLIERPGAFFFVGAQKEGHDIPHHHPLFDIDESALPLAAKTLLKAYEVFHAI
ncbi:M20 family metallopeptidase [Bacillaceae bacterium S4-13-58]